MQLKDYTSPLEIGTEKSPALCNELKTSVSLMQ